MDKINKKSRALLKITKSHIYPNSFQKMRVKLVSQLFSHTMGSVICTCVATNELKSSTAIDTAYFVDLMNKLFDCVHYILQIFIIVL